MNREVAIVLTIENGAGIISIGSLMMSILEHTNAYDVVKFFVLVNGDIDDFGKKILKKIKWFYSNCIINCVDIQKSIEIKRGEITSEELDGYYRILCPELIDEDECLCLGSNIIVKRDMTSLYERKIKDSCSIAGVRSLEATWDNATNENLQMALGLDDLKQYIYSDVLLLNLNRMRQENFVGESITLLKNTPSLTFQNLINKVLFGKIDYLPLQCNVSNEYFLFIETWFTEIYTEEELYYADQFPVIIRFGYLQPWVNSRQRGSGIWWRYAEQLLDPQLIGQLKNLEKRESGSSLKVSLLEESKKYKSIVIFGFTKLGKEILDFLMDEGVEKVRCFCDNSLEKRGQLYRGMKVELLDQLKFNLQDTLFINVSQKAYNSIDNQLLRYGIQYENIFHFMNKKNIKYYMTLDDKYYREELQWIKEREGSYNVDILNLSLEELEKVLKAKEPGKVAKYLIDKYWMNTWFLAPGRIS